MMNVLNIGKLFFSLVLLIFATSCSDREISFEKLKKRADGLYYAINEEKPFSGKSIKLYANGQKEKEVTLKSGKVHGLFTRWHRDGQKTVEMGYQNGAMSGQCRTWYENGQQRVDGKYKNDKEVDKWVMWYSNGKKREEGKFKDGNRKGKWKYWTIDGEKMDTDEVADIDGNTYMTIKVGDQWWMAENLKVTKYRNGDSIPNVIENKAWRKLTSGGYCSYDNNVANAETYGYLYNWYSVKDSRGIAPKGWHVPNDVEWQTLIDYLFKESGGKIKKDERTHFPVLFGGRRHMTGDSRDIKRNASFWSSTESNQENAWSRRLFNNSPAIGRAYFNKNYGISVRCVKN